VTIYKLPSANFILANVITELESSTVPIVISVLWTSAYGQVAMLNSVVFFSHLLVLTA